jgi:hypothetical protein
LKSGLFLGYKRIGGQQSGLKWMFLFFGLKVEFKIVGNLLELSEFNKLIED